MHRRLAKIAACLCWPSMKLIHTLSFLLFVFTRSNNLKNVSTWSPFALKLSTHQGHRSVGGLLFAHILLFSWLTKTAWNFPLGQGCRNCCVVGTSSFLFFVYTVGVQSIHVDLVIFRIHVDTLMLVRGLLVILLDCGNELDVDIFSPYCWIQLLHKYWYSYFPCAIPWPRRHGKSYPTWCRQYSMLLPHSKNCG